MEQRYLTRAEFGEFLEEWRKEREENSKRWEGNQKIIRQLLRNIARHGDILGFGLESMAAGFVPMVLEQKYGIKVKKLSRRFLYIKAKISKIRNQ